MSPIKRDIDKALNAFGNHMGRMRDLGHKIERTPERVVKGTVKAAVKTPGALVKGGADVGVGVLKELSSIVAHAGREATGTKKRKGPYKSNVAKGWFE